MAAKGFWLGNHQSEQSQLAGLLGHWNYLVADDSSRECWSREVTCRYVLGSSHYGVHPEEFPIQRQPRAGMTSVSRRLFYRKLDQRGQKWPHISQEPEFLSGPRNVTLLKLSVSY